MIKRVIGSDVFKMVVSLAIVGIISAISLVFVYDYSMPRITENVNKATQQGIKNIFPEADKIEDSTLTGFLRSVIKTGMFLGMPLPRRVTDIRGQYR